MRSIALACTLFLGLATAAMAQATSGVSHDGDIALTYHWVHTNAPPGGGCGCFALNGGGLSASWNLGPQLAAVAEFSVDHTAAALRAHRHRYRLRRLGDSAAWENLPLLFAGGQNAVPRLAEAELKRGAGRSLRPHCHRHGPRRRGDRADRAGQDQDGRRGHVPARVGGAGPDPRGGRDHRAGARG